MGAEDTHGAPRLHEHGLVVGQGCQRADHRIEGRPVTRGPPGAAVDNEFVRVLGNLGVEVVLQHAQRGLLWPTACRQRRAARGGDGASAGECVGHVRSPFGRWGVC